MNSRKYIFFIILIFLAATFFIWFINRDKTIEKNNGGKIRVITSIIPQKYFVEKVGGSRVDVTYMVEKGASPATYEPKPSQIKEVEEAILYIKIGVPFEEVQLPKFENVNSGLKVVDQGKDVPRIEMVSHHHDEGEEDHETGENEDLDDPHIWLSPKRAKKQAENIYNVLLEVDPANESYYKENLERFKAEIDDLDQKIEDKLSGINKREFLVFHPAYGYFADDYGLEQIPIEIEGKEPSVKELDELVTLALEKDLSVVFVQDQFSQETANKIVQRIGGKVVPLDPLAEDWVANLEKIAESLSLNN